MILFRYPLFILLLLLATPAISLVVQRPVSSSSANNSRAVPTIIDLRKFFKDEYAPDSELLSPTGIVKMMSNDATPTSLTKSAAGNSPPLRQEMFASPLISVLYERILPPLWAAGLRVGGPDEEYKQAMAYLLREEEKDQNAIALDLSCGTGFVGIRMAKSGRFRHVFGLDYSSQMLGEAVATAKKESRKRDIPLSIIRGDAGRLPFRDNAIDVVHWGAAMHCVPDAEQAMREVHRVLKPGGKVYATTFLRPFPDIVFRFFNLRELKGIAKGAGFGRDDGGELEVEALKRVYGVIRAMKRR